MSYAYQKTNEIQQKEHKMCCIVLAVVMQLTF